MVLVRMQHGQNGQKHHANTMHGLHGSTSESCGTPVSSPSLVAPESAGSRPLPNATASGLPTGPSSSMITVDSSFHAAGTQQQPGVR